MSWLPPFLPFLDLGLVVEVEVKDLVHYADFQQRIVCPSSSRLTNLEIWVFVGPQILAEEREGEDQLLFFS